MKYQQVNKMNNLLTGVICAFVYFRNVWSMEQLFSHPFSYTHNLVLVRQTSLLPYLNCLWNFCHDTSACQKTENFKTQPIVYATYKPYGMTHYCVFQRGTLLFHKWYNGAWLMAL